MRTATVIFTLCISAACAHVPETDEDSLGDDGPSATAGGGSAGSSPTVAVGNGSTTSAGPSGSSSATAGSGAGGGNSTCDGTANCGACQQCAFAGPCAAPYNTCMANGECVALNNCMNGCQPSDQPCLDACTSAHPMGVSQLQAAATCVFCTACSNDCSGNMVGCM